METIHILLVEDNPGDVFLTMEALEDSSITYKTDIAHDGEDAIKYINQAILLNTFPDLILLDINLPKMSGFDVLDFIKKDEATKRIPVIMLSTSSSPQDINKSYGKYANSYISKPTEIGNYASLVKVMENFWLQTAELPSR